MSAVIAIIAMGSVACNSKTTETPLPTPTYTLIIDSFKIMEFPVEGGKGVIEWSLKLDTRSSASPQFSTEAEWIELNPNKLGEFTVAANEGVAREADIVITYLDQTQTIAVVQDGAVVEDEAIELVAATRLSCEEYELPLNNFAILFEDGAEEYELALLLVGAEGDEVLAEGVYSVDNGGLDPYSSLLVCGDTEYEIAEGVAEVSLVGQEYDFDITLTTVDGEEYNFVYSGEVVNMVQESAPVEPVAFSPECIKAEYYMIGNFFLQLYIDDTRYHELDMLDEIAPNDDYLSAGIYSYAAETISTWSTFSTGNDQTCALADAEITITHNEDNTTTITGYIKSEEGDHITINWTGVVEGFVYEKETGKIFTVEALSAKVEYDKEGQKDILFMTDEFSGHKFSFKADDIIAGKPLADGEYSSEAGSIDIAYSVHGYGDVYGDMTSAKATVVNDLEAGTTSFDIEWEYEGNIYKLAWSGAVAGINYAEDVVTEPLDFSPVYVEMVRVTNSDRYFYFYDRYENELVLNYYNGKILLPYINYEGVKIDIDTNDFTFEYSDNGLGKEDGLYTYNVRLVTLDGRLIEFKGNILTYYSNN